MGVRAFVFVQGRAPFLSEFPEGAAFPRARLNKIHFTFSSVLEMKRNGGGMLRPYQPSK